MGINNKKTNSGIISLSFIALVFNSGCSVFGIRTVEEPEYKVVESQGCFEIRQYNAQLIAKTKMTQNMDKGTNDSFRKIAKFIFGDNKQNKAVAMTAPVVQEKKGVAVAMTAPVIQSLDSEEWSMHFVMPSEYTLKTLPQPIDPDVLIEEIPAKKVAVIKYSGFVDEEKISKKKQKLLSWLKERGIKSEESARSARYDPPWTIPFLRKNEVHLTVLDKK